MVQLSCSRALSIANVAISVVALNSAALGLSGSVAQAQTFNTQTADSIVVEGNRRVEASTVRSYFKAGPSGRLAAQNIDDAYKALYATALFQDVRISQSGGRIVVTLVENPVINRIAFQGNRKVKEEQLKLEIQSKERGTLSRATVQSDVQRIVEVYRRGGRLDVHIEPKVIELPNSRVDLVFEISEGAKTDVKTIAFVGNRAYSTCRLKDEIKIVETAFSPSCRSPTSATLIGSSHSPSKYRVGTIDVRSQIPALSPRILEPRLQMSGGDVYNAGAIEKSVENMTIEAARQGFAYFASAAAPHSEYLGCRIGTSTIPGNKFLLNVQTPAKKMQEFAGD